MKRINLPNQFYIPFKNKKSALNDMFHRYAIPLIIFIHDKAGI